jgi:hypothetical protein
VRRAFFDAIDGVVRDAHVKRYAMLIALDSVVGDVERTRRGRKVESFDVVMHVQRAVDVDRRRKVMSTTDERTRTRGVFTVAARLRSFVVEYREHVDVRVASTSFAGRA